MSEISLYVVVRRDLKLRRGKEIAQGIHAMAQLGYVKGLPLIVLQAADEEHLQAIMQEAEDAGVPYAFTRDAGRTEVEPNTLTAVALGPVPKMALQRLREAKLY